MEYKVGEHSCPSQEALGILGEKQLLGSGCKGWWSELRQVQGQEVEEGGLLKRTVQWWVGGHVCV